MHKHWVSKWHKLCGAPAPVDAVPRVLVTRPEQDAAPWVAALQGAGLEATTFPLLALSPVLQVQDLRNVHAQLQGQQAVMFVSANAVRFLAQSLGQIGSWPMFKTATRAWCTGPGTAAALLACGVPAAQIDQPGSQALQLDSEALWDVVAGQVHAQSRILLVRGADESGAVAGRDWLTQRLQAAGAQVDTLVAYTRLPVHLNPQQRQQASQFASDGSIWLFSSSESILALQTNCPRQDWSHARAVATHPRIAKTAQDLGWGRVIISPAGMSALAASIKSLE